MNRAVAGGAAKRRPASYQTSEEAWRRREEPGDVTKQYSSSLRNKDIGPSHMDEGRYAGDTIQHQRKQMSRSVARRQKMSRALMYVTFVLFVVLCFVQITRLAGIAQNTKQISDLTTNIQKLASEKITQNQRLSMQQNINRVKEEAIHKLGMIQPEDGQIRVVSLNGHSVSTQTRTADGSSAMGGSE